MGIVFKCATRHEAEAANRSKSEFLATMSHEIRTPINAVPGYTDLRLMGLEGPVTAGQEKQLARIRFSSEHLTGLVDQLLDFARIEAGTLRVERRTALAHDAASTALSVLAPQAEARGITLSAECDGQARYTGDPQRVDQILLNLVSNAIKFTEPGGHARLRCSLSGDGDAAGHAGGGVWLRVEDTGIGIAPEQLERIFEPFVQGERVHAAARGRGAGAGDQPALRAVDGRRPDGGEHPRRRLRVHPPAPRRPRSASRARGRDAERLARTTKR